MKSTLAAYKEELEVNLVEVYDDANNVNCVGEAMRQYIPSIEDIDLEQFVIYKGKLMYIGDDTNRAEVANSMNIESGSAVTQDIVKVTDMLNQICNSITPPADDTQPTPSDCVGIRLYDKTLQNATNWKLLIEYSNSNVEKERYGSGWFLLKSGTLLSDGTEVKNDYVINYNTNEMVLISNYTVWDIDSTLATTDKLAINIDALNVATGNWGNLTIEGDDAIYDASERAIALNRSSDNGTTYMTTSASELKMDSGFTFSMLYKFDRLCDPNGIGEHFLPLLYVQEYLGASRESSYRCHFYINNRDGIYTRFGSGVDYSRTFTTGMKINTIQQLTVKFIPLDGFYYYLNGEQIDYAAVSESQLNTFIRDVNLETYTCYIGTSVYGYDDNYHYLQGFIYGMQLYNKYLTDDEIKDNYDMQLRYRNSFN